MVGHLRRWSPRHERGQRLADWALAVWLTLTVTMAVQARPLSTVHDLLPDDARAVGRVALGLLLLAGLAVAPWIIRRINSFRTLPTRGGAAVRSLARYRVPLDRRTARAAGGLAVLAVAGWLIVPPGATAAASGWELVNPHTRGWALAALYGVAVWAIAWLTLLRRDRRLVLLVVDDLDRCEGERVVRLLSTIQTLLRERAAPRFLRRWRRPAKLAVLVLANGAWIRDAFSKHYETFAHPGDDTVHDLGADFLQEIFEHSVLVPSLTPDQTRDLTHDVAKSRQVSARDTAPRLPRMRPLRPAGAPFSKETNEAVLARWTKLREQQGRPLTPGLPSEERPRSSVAPPSSVPTTSEATPAADPSPTSSSEPLRRRSGRAATSRRRWPTSGCGPACWSRTS